MIEAKIRNIHVSTCIIVMIFIEYLILSIGCVLFFYRQQNDLIVYLRISN